jgi:hypothetical protein
MLALGALGTALALLTVSGIVQNSAMFFELPIFALVLFGACATGGVLQWVLFFQRRYDAALVMFGLTPLCWCLAIWVHVADACAPDPIGRCRITVTFKAL